MEIFLKRSRGGADRPSEFKGCVPDPDHRIIEIKEHWNSIKKTGRWVENCICVVVGIEVTQRTTERSK
jgi:hypothetical protein